LNLRFTVSTTPAATGFSDTTILLLLLGLAEYYDIAPDYEPVNVRDLAPKARAAAEKALEIDSSLAEAHAVLGDVHLNTWEWAAAERELKRALELDQNSGPTHRMYWIYLANVGRQDEALKEIQTVLRLDPLNLKANENLGQQYATMGRDDQAMEQFKKVVEMDPGFAPVHGDIAGVYFLRGKYDLWIQENKQFATLANQPEYVTMFEEVGKVYDRSGLEPALREWVEQEKALSKRRYEDPAYIGFVCAAAGQKDEAFAWLEKGFKEKSEAIVYVKTTRFLEPLRSDPRYGDLLKRMGLPQ
jgi:tetratricopeptide (TPR) repeat protein